MHISNFEFDLPPELIATHPAYPRESSKMIIVKEDNFIDSHFSSIIDEIKEGDIIIFNNSKVIPAKLTGNCNGKIISMNLHKMISPNIWKLFAKKTKKLQISDKIIFADDFSATIIHKDNGEITLEFHADNCLEKFEQYGQIPIPPYIKREVDQDDSHNYQTIYATKKGSVAAPTAGLHFSQDIIDKIEKKGAKIAYVTLHVGAGTFMPIKTENILEHKMHSEICEISQNNADLINQTKQNGGRIFAVGTTSLRTLESVAAKFGHIQAFFGETDIFIYPGFEFKVVDRLLTNFHLPCSTLLLLISAFASTNRIKKLYQHAITKNYRFYSYGDCCLLERNYHDTI